MLFPGLFRPRVAIGVLLPGLLIALIGLFVAARPGGPALIGVDGPAPGQELGQEQRRAEALEERDAAVRRRLAEKAEVTAEVIAGRLSLAEAIDRFRRLRAARDEAPDTPSRLTGDDDAIAQNVLNWVFWRLDKEPSRQVEVMTRLEKERAEWQARRRR